MTTLIDNRDSRFGIIHAARRVSRTIFLGSAPTTSGQRIRGINAEHIRLGCTQPGQSSGIYDDALRRLNDQLYYLYSGNDRYWYDIQTNLRREAEDRMSRFSKEDHLLPEISRRLKNTLKGGPFSGIHVFTPHGDVPDDTHLRLIVLPPTAFHVWKQKESMAIKTASAIIRNRGQQPRLNQNRLIFLCADVDAVATVYDNSKRYLAWQSIVDDKDVLNLDQHRIKEATKNRNDYDERLNGVLAQAYRWVLAPNQEPNPKGGVGDIYWEEQRVTFIGTNIVPAIADVLIENEMLISQWSPIHLIDCLNRWYLKADRQDIGLSTLWNDFCRYPYLPRLVNTDVFRDTVAAGIESMDFFGYASGKDGDRYIGLIFGRRGTVYIDESSLIVHKEAAQRQLDIENKLAGAPDPDDDSGYGKTGGDRASDVGVAEGGPGVVGPGPKEGLNQEVFRRFHGSIKLNPISASLDFSTITQEIIQHFSCKLGTSVNITLEIEAVSDKGFDDSLRRTVQENSRTLGFNHAEFEED
jgi:hypothetical protein